VGGLHPGVRGAWRRLVIPDHRWQSGLMRLLRAALLTWAVVLSACHATSDGGAARETKTPSPMPAPNHSLPSRADLLKNGGLYPIPVPRGWKLIDTEGEDVALPVIPSDPFHKVLARGALLATEIQPGGLPEAMTLRQYAFAGAPAGSLQAYATLILNGLRGQQLGARVLRQESLACALTPGPCAKLVVERISPADDRIEVHYLLRDHAGLSWELVYLLRRDNLSGWAPLLGVIEGPAPGA
jgi:hypothetical protein